MQIDERVLRLLCRPPGSSDCQPSGADLEGQELSLLAREFAGFDGMFRGRRVLDYGCGTGRQAVAIALREAEFVCGIDTNPKMLEAARERAARAGLAADRIVFAENVASEMAGRFDLVVSQNSMEHYGHPDRELKQMKRLLALEGQILMTFAPPWLAPFGAHMHFFCPVPWVHLFFRESTVMKVRQLYRDDGAMRYEDVESGLNRMTIRKFERTLARSGMSVRYLRYRCVKKQDWLARVGLVREFFIIRVSCILSLAETAAEEERARSLPSRVPS